MLTYTYIREGKFSLVEKPKPTIQHERDAIVKVTLASICSSDLHIKHGSVPRAVEGITVGHEMVGIVEQIGSEITHVKPGDRVTVNVETFCGECFFCKKGFVNNCTDKNGGWALGCRIDGGQAEYVRVPFADQGLNKIPDTVTDRQALLVGDVLATGYWAAKISEITEDDTVLIIGAGPTGICTLLCVMLKNPKRIIVCEKDENRIVLCDFGDLRRPITRGENITNEQSLSVGHGIGNLVQPLIRERHANVLCLTAVNAATERPTTVLVGAVVDKSFLAEEALAAEGFHVDSDSVAGLYVRDSRADFFHNANHLVPDRDSFHRSRHAAVLDVEITRTDACKSHLDNRIPLVLYRRL